MKLSNTTPKNLPNPRQHFSTPSPYRSGFSVEILLELNKFEVGMKFDKILNKSLKLGFLTFERNRG
jgi:hypothetical protein